MNRDFRDILSELLKAGADRETLIRNKRATGRLRDLADLEALGEEDNR